MAQTGSAPINSSFQLNGGGTKMIFGKKVAGIFALTYNQTNRRLPFSNSIIANDGGDIEVAYNNNKYSRDILAGALANIAIQLNSNNKISAMLPRNFLLIQKKTNPTTDNTDMASK